MNDSPDWQARAAAEALAEQRRHPRWYPSTKEERLLEYSDELYYEKNHEEPEDE